MPYKVAVASENPSLHARGRKFARHDAYRDAGRASVAGGPIRNHLAAAEARMGQRFVELLGEGAGQACEDLSLNTAGQIRARSSRRKEKLRQPGGALVCHNPKASEKTS